MLDMLDSVLYFMNECIGAACVQFHITARGWLLLKSTILFYLHLDNCFVVSARFCDHVLCDSNLFSSTCPEDSVALPASPVVLEDNCCPPVKHEYVI